jgi:uncharacterized membrane-anchored protein YhcB (DUF1043 family)
MRNFGLLKSIVENSFVSTYKTDDFKRIVKEFKEFIDNNKEVGEVFIDYGTIMKTNNLNEDVAKDFLKYSVETIKTKINNNKRQFEEFDSWVETLNEDVTNDYQDIDNMVNAKNASDFINLIESKNKLTLQLISKDVENESQLTETINIPISDMLNIVSETFAKEYSELSESELFELKSILRMDSNELNEGISRLKTEILNKLDSVQIDDDVIEKTINSTKVKVENTSIDSLSYYRLKKLSESI